MNVDQNTPRRERTISGIKVQVPAPYAPGHVVTEAEANILNQTLAENISNNLRDKLNPTAAIGTEGTEGYVASKPAPSETEAQTLVDEYIKGYEPGVRGAGGGAPRIVDPVEREARSLATARVVEVLKSKGILRKNVDNFDDLVQGAFDKRKDEYMAQAKKIVALREKAGGADDDDLGEISVKAAAPAAA